MWQKMTHGRLSSRNTLPAKGRPLQAKGKRFANSSVSIVDKKSTKGTVTLMAANFCPVNSAYDEIFNRFSDDEESDK